jgi:hypothetical protein
MEPDVGPAVAGEQYRSFQIDDRTEPSLTE